MRHGPKIHITRSAGWTYCGVLYYDGSRAVITLAQYEEAHPKPDMCSTCERGVLAHMAARERAIEGKPVCR